MANYPAAFDGSDFAIQLLNGTFNLGKDALFYRLAVTADPRHTTGTRCRQ
jgi:hypothetical protein